MVVVTSAAAGSNEGSRELEGGGCDWRLGR